MKGIVYQEHSLDEVMRYFAKDFKPNAGESLEVLDYFIDSGKRRVVFKILPVERKDSEGANNGR